MEKKTFVVYGKQPVLEALKSEYNIFKLWYSKDLPGKLISHISKRAQQKNITLRAVHKNEIQKISGPVVHQGLALEMEPPKLGSQQDINTFLKSKNNHFIIILDQIQDPHNLGAILRTAEICGVDAVIIPEKGSAQLNDTVAKTSAGALFHLKIFKVNNLEIAIEELTANKIKTYALMPGFESSMYEKKLNHSCAIVVGSEGPGVRKNISSICSDTISIPQFGKIESLNASVASAIILYEVVRQRRAKN